RTATDPWNTWPINLDSHLAAALAGGGGPAVFKAMEPAVPDPRRRVPRRYRCGRGLSALSGPFPGDQIALEKRVAAAGSSRFDVAVPGVHPGPRPSVLDALLRFDGHSGSCVYVSLAIAP